MGKEENILKKYGWEIECESPYEIRHEDGSFATGQAAYMVTDAVKENNIIDEYEKLMELTSKLRAYESIVNQNKDE
jgi:hypothetical protein